MKRVPLLVNVIVAFCSLLVAHDVLGVWSGEWYAKDPYPDYAPKGVPDFDQRYNDWGKVPGLRDPADPRNNPNDPEWLWTWDGPLAWSDSIWWMDSRFESYFNPHPVPPPTVSDTFGLIYSPDPTSLDDHSPENVPNVVSQIAQFFRTDGDPWCSWSGTQIMDMVYGLENGLEAAGFGKRSHPWPGPYFVVGVRDYPSFYEIVREVTRCEDVVVLLGFYEENPQLPGNYMRVGGHYVAVAATNGQEKLLRICDPFLNIANPSPTPKDHMDAAVVSYDEYKARSLFPLGCALTDYPWSVPGHPLWGSLAKNFKGINPAPNTTFTTERGLGYLTLVEYMVHLSPEWDTDLYKKPRYDDYAPSGVPDFDQRQDKWGKVPGAPSPDDPMNDPQNRLWRWTWCGPVALANSLWWLDSRMEEVVLREQGMTPVPPPQVSDHFSLVEAYGKWDDHDAQNVPPFVSDLAKRTQADGQPWCAWLGTYPTDLRDAAIAYLKERNLYYQPEVGLQPGGIYFEVVLTPNPTFEQVAKEVYRCQDVILLLGFYEYTEGGLYARVGGHYVSCVGVDGRGSRIVLSDPFVDTLVPALATSGGEQPLQYTPPELHNEAAIVSHDEYHVGTLSDGEFWLTDYPWSIGPQHELFPMLRGNFDKVNAPKAPGLEIEHSCEYITKVEYMLHISPVFWYWKGPHHDYAQAGVPDFSQKQDKWGKNPQAPDPGDPLNDPLKPGWRWTWCGPVAVANSLWWLDSQFETLLCPVGGLVKPPVVSDHFPLLKSYVANADDHHAANVPPFVADLAKYMKADGEPWCAWDGTRVKDMVEGIKTYIAERGLGPADPKYGFWFEVGLTQDPDFMKDISVQLRRSQDVILLLGFYRLQEGFYTRVGGHFVTAAGVNEKERQLAVSDPWFDTPAGDNGPTYVPGRFGYRHEPVEHATHQHNDADFVSHDAYRVGRLTDGENYLVDYPWSDYGDERVWEELEMNFSRANAPEAEMPILRIEPVGTLLTKIEYMVHVSPAGKLVAVPKVTPDHVAPGQMITFDGTASYHTNPARSIVKYEWDLDGDGIYDASGAVVGYAYPSFGIYHGSLRVTDDDIPAWQVESFFDVFVDIGNNPPVANANGPYAIDEGNDLALNGSGSYDPDTAYGDKIVSWLWDLDNDGLYDDAVGEMPTVPWSVISGLKRYPDTNDISLRVKDKLGVTDTDTTTLTIYKNYPIALFTVSPNPAAVGEVVTFDASGSSHGRPDRSIVKYEWDLDGDGTLETIGKIVTRTYTAPASFEVTLRVTDDNSPPKTAAAKMLLIIKQAVPPEEIAVGLGNAGRGLFEMVDASNYVLTHFVWKRVPWYRGETRPALGDFDGDGRSEVVVGLGGGGGGRLAIFEDRNTSYAFSRWLVLPSRWYNAMNGETWPACGDVDGDRKDEIVVGLGEEGGGWFCVFNDAGTGYAIMGWYRIPDIMPVTAVAALSTYNASRGETRPAVGDIDGDRKAEIVMGLGPYPPNGGWFCMFDDALFGFPFMGWRRVPYPAYNAANGETWPVTGDVDGDAKEEIVIGLGTYPVNGGWMIFFDDPVSGGILGRKRLPWMGYNASNGAVHPATANIDKDAAAELVVGLGSGGLGRMWIADDWSTGVAHRGWYQIPLLPYSLVQGLSRPRAKSPAMFAEEKPEDWTLAGGVGLTPPEPHESLYGSISGHVSIGGISAAGVWVTAYNPAITDTHAARTDGSGNYRFDGLVPGRYRVGLADPRPTPVGPGGALGAPVMLGMMTNVDAYAAVETPGVDLDVPATGSISGRVTDEAATPSPIVGAIVSAYVDVAGGSWELAAQAETDMNGNYTLESLLPGTYYLEALPPNPDYLGEYYDDVPALPSNQPLATPVAVGAGENVSGKNFALGVASSISGTVTDDLTDVVIEGATVILYVSEGGQWQTVDSTQSDWTGAFQFRGLPPGTYYLEANYPQGGYAGEYYDNIGALVMNRGSATPIVLLKNSSQTGKNFALSRGGAIAGKVTASPGGSVLESVAVTVYEQDWGAIAGQTTTNVNGDYTVGNLPSGRYGVSADGRALGYSAQYYDGQPMTEQGKANASLLPVTLGLTTSGINFALPGLTSISGTVTDDAATPNLIEGALVVASTAAGGPPVASATSGNDGGYEVTLEAGSYFVRAEAPGYAVEHYREASDPSAAEQVSPGAGSPVSGVDFTLMPVGFIVVVSDVQFAPFTLSCASSPDIKGNTGAGRMWESGPVKTGLWTIIWGSVDGFDPPVMAERYVHLEEVSFFFGDYALAVRDGFKVNIVDVTGTGDERRVRIRWYAEVGKMYQIQAMDSLGPGVLKWIDSASPFGGIGGMMSYEELIGTRDTGFYRLKAY